MSPEATERRLAAILSADVAGYSRLMAEDEQGTIQTLNAHREASAPIERRNARRSHDHLVSFEPLFNRRGE